ncbi:hypothetical protein B0H14DRAFT_124766 [Mycena olivaceomarginata]|nr:hypothetical protein B0H14DRAFT_124766 [Mycena olivaceomarginata]
MAGDSSTQSEATELVAPSTRLSLLSNRIKSRLALRRLYFSSQTACADKSRETEEDSDREDRSSDSELSDTTPPPPKPATVNHRRYNRFNLYYWNRPSIQLLDLPLEIIENIAEQIRDPKPLMDTAALYISDKKSDFSEARFALSALSKTCSELRCAVERVLYRNIQLDFTGWKGRKHTGWPAGSLRLLLRTLEERPELGRFIYVTALDFQLSSTDSEALEKGLEEFLMRTPNLTHLFLSQCPVAFWDLPTQHLRGFATTFAPGILPSLLEQLTSLRDLHLRDCHVMALHGELPSHNLQRIRLDSSHEYASAHFARVLTICGDSVHDLDVRFIGGLQLPAPCFLSDSGFGAAGGAALRTLRLDNISVLSHLSSGYAHLLRGLPALEHLHVSHHAPFAAEAFGMLPASLRCLVATAYYGLWTTEKGKNGFVAALVGCISMSTREIARVEGSRGGGKKWDERLDLLPVVEACKTERIPCSQVDDPFPFVTIFFGTKVSCKNTNEAGEELNPDDEEDEDADDEVSFQDVLAAIPTRIPKLRVSPDRDVGW